MTDTTNRKTALARSDIYAFIVESFIRLPDASFIKEIKNERTFKFLNGLKRINQENIRKGINKIEAFINQLDVRCLDTMNMMAVDRTKLIRPTGTGTLKPPYESAYKKEKPTTEIILEVKRSYKKAGIIPANTNDGLDFFCTQLDFMKQLCIKEAYDHDLPFIRNIEKEFMTDHLGSWIDRYCNAALDYAQTDFYRGLLMLMKGFVEIEEAYQNAYS